MPEGEFGSIRADYAFFEAHATEAAEDVRAYLPHVQGLSAGDRPVRMLDFGCGDGRFSALFHAGWQLPPHRLHLTLVEPDDVYRQQAQARLQPLTIHPIWTGPNLPPHFSAQFDLILANHVLYYVSHLEDTVAGLVDALAPAGLFMMALAGAENTLIQFWEHCFGLLDMGVPYYTAGDLEAVFTRRGIQYTQEPITYELAFTDTDDNRLSIMRFLMGSYFPRVPRQAMLDCFALFAVAGKIVMPITHHHYYVRV